MRSNRKLIVYLIYMYIYITYTLIPSDLGSRKSVQFCDWFENQFVQINYEYASSVRIFHRVPSAFSIQNYRYEQERVREKDDSRNQKYVMYMKREIRVYAACLSFLWNYYPFCWDTRKENAREV